MKYGATQKAKGDKYRLESLRDVLRRQFEKRDLNLGVEIREILSNVGIHRNKLIQAVSKAASEDSAAIRHYLEATRDNIKLNQINLGVAKTFGYPLICTEEEYVESIPQIDKMLEKMTHMLVRANNNQGQVSRQMNGGMMDIFESNMRNNMSTQQRIILALDRSNEKERKRLAGVEEYYGNIASEVGRLQIEKALGEIEYWKYQRKLDCLEEKELSARPLAIEERADEQQKVEKDLVLNMIKDPAETDIDVLNLVDEAHQE